MKTFSQGLRPYGPTDLPPGFVAARFCRRAAKTVAASAAPIVCRHRHSAPVPSPALRIVIVIAVLFACTAWADCADNFMADATFIVSAGSDPAGGLRQLPGMAKVTLIGAGDAHLKNVEFRPEDPTSLYKLIDRQTPCEEDPEAFRIWIYGVAPEKTNTNVACRFQGEIHSCTSGPGSGGSSEPPRFAAQVVHIDLDVDSLNKSDPWPAQKKTKPLR